MGQPVTEVFMSKRQHLQLASFEDAALRALYREYGIPIDQFIHRHCELAELVKTWNEFTGRSETPQDVFDYMMTKRKSAQWERLGRASARNPGPHAPCFTDEELTHLDAIHEDFQLASDKFATCPAAGKKLQAEFARRTKRIVSIAILAAAMVTRRKSGKLKTLKPKSKGQNLGFTDIDRVAN